MRRRMLGGKRAWCAIAAAIVGAGCSSSSSGEAGNGNCIALSGTWVWSLDDCDADNVGKSVVLTQSGCDVDVDGQPLGTVAADGNVVFGKCSGQATATRVSLTCQNSSGPCAATLDKQ